MNDNFEELIHDGIDQLTAGSTLPADLAARARRNVRRRQHQVRAAVAAGTAAAAAIAVIAATSAGSAGTTPETAAGPRPSPSIALLARVERAVASKAGSEPVLQVKTTFSAGQQFPAPDPFSAEPFYPGGTARAEIIWTRGHVFKSDLLNAKSQIVTATRTTDARKVGTSTHVDYASRTWWRISLDWSVAGRAFHSRCLLLPIGPMRARDWSPRNLAKDIKHAIACGQAEGSRAAARRRRGRDQADLRHHRYCPLGRKPHEGFSSEHVDRPAQLPAGAVPVHAEAGPR